MSRRLSKTITSEVGDCLTCGKRWEGIGILNNARQHAKSTGHRVIVEQARSYRYN